MINVVHHAFVPQLHPSEIIQPNPDPASPTPLPWDPPITTTGHCLKRHGTNIRILRKAVFHHIYAAVCRFKLDTMTKTKEIMAQAFEHKSLTSGWSFKQTDTEEWLSVPHVPTNVHLDLLHHEKYYFANQHWYQLY